ncbi:MAG: hypothetical protein ABL880_04740 [Methylotenera sp.]
MSVQIFLIVVAASAGYFFWRKTKNAQKSVPSIKKASHPKKGAKTKSATQNYKCVEIKTGLMPCKAVGVYKSKRLLMNEAPMLPLSGCNNSKECECKFARYEDRRRGDRRTMIKAAASQIIAEQENKRIRRDRRKSKAT